MNLVKELGSIVFVLSVAFMITYYIEGRNSTEEPTSHCKGERSL